jgi:beta-phosphoglucomutase
MKLGEEDMEDMLQGDWISQYGTILFDFDGLLVNTEYLHYQAYQKMCIDRGFTLHWDFKTYCSLAHMGSECLKKGVKEILPELYQNDAHWLELYQEKKEAFLHIVAQGQVELMPGVEALLKELNQRGVTHCVVTHSSSKLTDAIRAHLPALNTIPHWVTRECYDQPKPKPDGYLEAIRLYSKRGDRILGFEDTVRGWRALQAASVEAVVVSKMLTTEMQKILADSHVTIYQSFEDLLPYGSRSS